MQQMILELAPPPAPTLENFFPGRNGAALAAVREALAGRERFVYVWGARGGGKSHLLEAFAQAARAAGRPAAHARAPQLDIPAAADLAEPYALAADDVERLDIVGQLALFDAYNALRAGAGCILAAGDRPATELPLREDLRTRIGSGVVLQVHPLSDGEKRGALIDHAARRGLRLPEDIVVYVLTRHARDMGSLVALLDALDRYSLQTHRPITLALVREALRASPKSVPHGRSTPT
jgi:DnaA family protein